jgi:serine/threonine protein phosphatase PrpC
MTMENEYYTAHGGYFVAIFDGHGGNGVSCHLKHHLYRRMQHYILQSQEGDARQC